MLYFIEWMNGLMNVIYYWMNGLTKWMNVSFYWMNVLTEWMNGLMNVRFYWMNVFTEWMDGLMNVSFYWMNGKCLFMMKFAWICTKKNQVHALGMGNWESCEGGEGS